MYIHTSRAFRAWRRRELQPRELVTTLSRRSVENSCADASTKGCTVYIEREREVARICMWRPLPPVIVRSKIEMFPWSLRGREVFFSERQRGAAAEKLDRRRSRRGVTHTHTRIVLVMGERSIPRLFVGLFCPGFRLWW